MKDNSMEKDLESKIKSALDIGYKITESEIRSLIILIRKRIELMKEVETQKYLIINLFCNWCAHTKIDKSNTGLRIIAKINDTLVEIKNSQDSSEIQLKLSQAIGYVFLRKELNLFCKNIGLNQYFELDEVGNNFWGHFIARLIEIIRDVPMTFPSIAELDSTKQKIYNQIAKNPIKVGAGVIKMKITKVTDPYPKETMVLEIGLEDTTRVVVPLLIDVRLI